MLLRSSLVVATALLLASAGVQTAKTPAYWLGIRCLPTIPALRAQLNLPERQGFLVTGVVAGSPAAAAGIAQHDILMRIGDKPLADPNDLVQAVETAKDSKLKIELIRGGKPMTIEVTPAKCPQSVGDVAAAAPGANDRETVRKWLEDMMAVQKGEGLRPPLQLGFTRPGMIVPPPRPLPANIRIVVSKEGDQPANISVHRGDQVWELTEKQLDKLPTDIRPYVERMLGRGTFVGNVQPNALGALRSGGMTMPFQSSPNGLRTSPQPAPDLGLIEQRLEKRMDDVSARMDRLLQIMEKMAGDQASPKAHPKGEGE